MNGISPALLSSFPTVAFQFGENAVLTEGAGDRVARNVRNVRQSSQLAIEKGICPLVGECCSLSVVMRPAMPRESMILTGIAVDRCVWSFSKCRFNLGLRGLGNELVFLGQMHQKGRIKPIDLAQIFLGIAAVISDRSVNAMATYGCQEDHQRAKAIAEDGDLAVALR